MEHTNVEFSQEVCEEMLDPLGWTEVLSTYGRTVGLAVTLTDLEGRQVGPCHNPQPAWLMLDGARVKTMEGTAACSFCADSRPSCQAVQTAIGTGRVELGRDRIGMVHLAVPLFLGPQQFGAVIAGQVFHQYPEPLTLQELEANLGLSPKQLWQQTLQQTPIPEATLRIYGELLFSLSQAFLRQRYATILDRRQARVNLRLRLLLDGVRGHALFTIDDTGLVTGWNRGAELIFGYMRSEIVGQNYSRLFTPKDIENGVPYTLLQQANNGGSTDDHGWQVRKDGTRFFAEGSLAAFGAGSPREFGRFIQDVTDRRSGEGARLQSQKLETIGLLASGIAHDFNNLLSAVQGGVGLAKSNVAEDHPAYPWLVIAEQACEKAANLTHQLLTYGGHGKLVETQFDLSLLVRDIVDLLGTAMPKSVQLELVLESDLPWINGDPSQIQQLLMNLVINGAESIGPEGGLVRISTGTKIGKEDNKGHVGLDVWMEVQDSGSGMTAETKARIFEPFFTTKFTGRGLGLAAVLGIVRGHHGKMEVESTIGKGSTFRIFFPGTPKLVQREETSTLASAGYNGGTVLVVDDEPALRQLAKSILEKRGYSVMVAKDGREAVELFRQHASTIAAILLDVTMPVMSGEEAFHLIREIRSDVPVLVTSGYSEAKTLESFGGCTTVTFLQKPYTPAQLGNKIEEISKAARAVDGNR